MPSKDRHKEYLRNKDYYIKKAGEYQQTEKGRIVRLAICKKYNKSEKGKATQKKYRCSERGKLAVKIYDANRNHFKRTNGTGINTQQWEDIIQRYNYRCAYCGVHEVVLITLGETMTQDHVTPISRGGKHSPNNIAPACVSCNTKKGVESWKPKIYGRPGVKIA